MRQMAISESELDRQEVKLWFSHNNLGGTGSMIHAKTGSFFNERIAPSFGVFPTFDFRVFGLPMEAEDSTNNQGNTLEHKFKHLLAEQQTDHRLLSKTECKLDRKRILDWKEHLKDIFGEILPAKLKAPAFSAVRTREAALLLGMRIC
jgi:hypothetical protein